MLRIEEIARRAIPGFLGRPDTIGQDHRPDDSTEFSYASADAVTWGDWVSCTEEADGHPNVILPGLDDDPAWAGVAQMAANAGQWVRVRGAGLAMARVSTSEDPSPGDWLVTQSGSGEAIAYDRTAHRNRCGRFLSWIGASQSGYAWVHIGSGGAQEPIQIHHHDSDLNTNWVDQGTNLVGESHDLFIVNSDDYTGGDPKLMLVLGGEATHGESITEGWAWGGVIGTNDRFGCGMLGGNETAGNQGPLGAEKDMTASGGDWRINIRSFAEYNTFDKFIGVVPIPGGEIAPFLFIHTYETPDWTVPLGCGQEPPASPCGTSVPMSAANNVWWWSGGFVHDDTHVPQNNTGRTGSFLPSVPVEVNCCLVYSAPDELVPPLCEPISNRSAFQDNHRDLNGAYENLIPYGYTVTNAARQEILDAVCCHSRHIQEIWRFLDRWTLWVGNYAFCNDAFFSTKADSAGQTPSTCCEDTGVVEVPALACGPSGKDTNCDGAVITPA